MSILGPFFLNSSIPREPPWGHQTPKLTTWRATGATFSRLEAPRFVFYRLFDPPNRHRKINDFSNPQKSTKVSFSIEPLAPKDRFFINNYDFWPPFLHRFFDFFQKWRKCEISEEYNAKRGSEPSKTSHFRLAFSSNFHVFSKTPSRGHFWRAQAPVYTQLIY